MVARTLATSFGAVFFLGLVWLVETQSAERTADLDTTTPTVIRGVGGTLYVSLPVINRDDVTLSNVRLTDLRLDSAQLIAPTSLPVSIGSVAPGESFQAQASFLIIKSDDADSDEGHGISRKGEEDGEGRAHTKELGFSVHGTYLVGDHTIHFVVRRDLKIPPAPNFRLAVNTTDELLLESQTSVGDLIDYFGQKDANGLALALTEVRVQHLSGAVVEYSLDREGRPTQATAAQGTIFSFNWLSETSGDIRVASADGTLNLDVPVDVSRSQPTAPPQGGNPRDAALFESRNGATVSPVLSPVECPGRKIQGVDPLISGQGNVNVQVSRCGPEDHAIVNVRVIVPGGTVYSRPATLTDSQAGIYSATLPTPGNIVNQFEASCQSVANALGNFCLGVKFMTASCAAISTALIAFGNIPAALAVISDCTEILSSAILVCATAGGKPLGGGPSVATQFCSLLTQAIDQATSMPILLTPSATLDGLDGVGMQVGATVPARGIGPFPPLSVSFPCFSLTGNWAGTATRNDKGGTETIQVSASISQMANSITATVVFTGPGDVPEIHTETGQINGSNISLPVTSNGLAVNVTGSFTPDGLTMSGTGTDPPNTNGSGTLTVSSGSCAAPTLIGARHIAGSARTSAGDSVTWCLDKQ
jgi:hypothetical protein